MTDSQLIQGCIAGDRKAREEFILRFLPTIYGSIRNTSKNRFEKFGKRISYNELEDLIQELSHDVVVSLFDHNCQALKFFEGKNGCPLGGYIGTIAIRKAIDYYRRIKDVDSIERQEDSEWGPSKEMVDAQTDPDAHNAFAGFMTKEVITKLLSYLEAEERRLCVLFFFEEKAPELIAKELGINVDNFYVRKQRVLKKLKDIAVKNNIC